MSLLGIRCEGVLWLTERRAGFTPPFRPNRSRGGVNPALHLEAMKMETALHDERDGVIERVVVPAEALLDAKDLLIAFSA